MFLEPETEEVNSPEQLRASYKTPFECFDGSYALISGADLTLEYDYGYQYSEVRMILLYPTIQLLMQCFVNYFNTLKKTKEEVSNSLKFHKLGSLCTLLIQKL